MLDEFYYLSKHVNMSYSDLQLMPTFERKFFIDKLSSEFQEKKRTDRKTTTEI